MVVQVADLLRQLEDNGVYAVTLRSTAHQELVDLRWAALHAGEHLGRRVRVAVTKQGHSLDSPVLVRVTCGTGRPAVPTQRQPLG